MVRHPSAPAGPTNEQLAAPSVPPTLPARHPAGPQVGPFGHLSAAPLGYRFATRHFPKEAPCRGARQRAPGRQAVERSKRVVWVALALTALDASDRRLVISGFAAVVPNSISAGLSHCCEPSRIQTCAHGSGGRHPYTYFRRSARYLMGCRVRRATNTPLAPRAYLKGCPVMACWSGDPVSVPRSVFWQSLAWAGVGGREAVRSGTRDFRLRWVTLASAGGTGAPAGRGCAVRGADGGLGDGRSCLLDVREWAWCGSRCRAG